MAQIAQGVDNPRRAVPHSLQQLDPERLPTHVAVIMDGNGRWAKLRGLDRTHGHREGARAVRAVVTRARELNIQYLTLFAFSTQNWERPSDEVQHLMQLLVEFCAAEQELMKEQGIRMRVIGERDRLVDAARQAIEEVERATAHNDQMQLIIAVSYGAREELVRAVQRIATQVQAGELAPEAIDASMLSKHLWTADMPDPDLVIRTSGELRISNFLLWQIAYAELYVDDCLWPDFREEAFDRALLAYQARDRRFGRVDSEH